MKPISLLITASHAGAPISLHHDLGDPSDVVPIVLITPEVAERYEELTDIAPDKNMVKELNQFNGKGDSEEENDTIERTFRADVKRWMQTKNNNGEWIIPIWEDRTFVEHVLTPSESWEKIEWLNQELKTCLRFQQIERKERRKYTSRLRLLGNQRLPCFSYLGMETIGDQDIGWVEKCSSPGHIAGFLMTALGFYYEHTRPDRDEHIDIHFENIAFGRDYAFYKLPEELNLHTALPYDHRSVLHFGSRSLSQPGKMAMTKKDGTEIIPNKYRATSLDIAKICDAYDCAEGCGHRWAQCTNKEPIFAHRICDGWVDCEDESDEKGCEGTKFTSCCKAFKIDHYNVKDSITYTYTGMFNGRMSYTADGMAHGKYLYYRQGKWAVGDVLGGQLAWYWTDDAKLDPADLFGTANSGGEKNLEDIKPNMFDESCPDGLEFRSTINAKAWFILDTCTDGDLQCSDCADMGQYSGQGNSGGKIMDPPKPGATNNPAYTAWADGMTKPGAPEAPTLPPHTNPALAICDIKTETKVKGGAWKCIGREGDQNGQWLAGSYCVIECKKNGYVGICGPGDAYPMDEPGTQPGKIRCLSTGNWDYSPVCKCQRNDCRKSQNLFTQKNLKIGAFYECSHLDLSLNSEVGINWKKNNLLGTRFRFLIKINKPLRNAVSTTRKYKFFCQISINKSSDFFAKYYLKSTKYLR